jgi:hypothetical protein
MAIIGLMMEAASTSETSVNFYKSTWRNNPEDSHLNTRRRENLKSHSSVITLNLGSGTSQQNYSVMMMMIMMVILSPLY